jgi:FkbM family methyltransferase
MERKIIYDFGSNNGDDIPYYLLKSDRVVAVEANPVLCEQINNRFSSEIKQGRLKVENCVITASENSEPVSFFIHKKNHVLSQFPKPPEDKLISFNEVLLPSKPVTQIIKEHGNPYYIKIDIEHYDSEILRALSINDIYPPFISAESHSIDVFCMLVNMGYEAFKLIDGETVSKIYSDRIIQSSQEDILYSFPHHSAGPFGNDIDGKWMTADNFFRLLAFEGLGWKDIHASRIESPDPSINRSLKEICRKVIMYKIKSSFRIIISLFRFA